MNVRAFTAMGVVLLTVAGLFYWKQNVLDEPIGANQNGVVEQVSIAQSKNKPEGNVLSKPKNAASLAMEEAPEKVEVEEGESTSSYQEAIAASTMPMESALTSMRESLEHGDERSPELSEPSDILQPTREELENPELYQQYELRNSLATGRAYYSAAQEIPALRSMIAQARRDGSRSTEEIQQAEEALLQLEKLQLELELTLQEVEEEVAQQVEQQK
ncbi:hypothetical protein A9Q99_09915 [Gammaproteobacteria bacterium 45_16_T64]|nr:hypothetical protein A9Q99_09915 [Gammaproteobacteria bacterium 45_16_T64]